MKLNLIQGFTFGFKINSLLDKKVDKFPSNHKSARENPDAVNLKLNKEIMKGRIKGPFDEPPFDKFICSPLGLIPKKESGSFRLIHDLSFPKGDSVNFWTPPEYTSVSYQNIETVIELVQEHGFNCEMREANTNKCSVALNTFLTLSKTLGVPIKDEKTQLPTTCITIYGIEIDSRAMVARLPKDKIAKFWVSLTYLSVVVPGRAFLRRLFDLTIGHSCPHYRITLNSEARADLRAWFDFVSNYNGKSCFLFQKWVSSESLKLYSDAAGVHGGYAAVFGSTWFAGEWPQNMLQLHITIKELFPIVLAVEIWGHSLSNHKVLFLTDNQAVADIINKTSSRDKILMKLVRRLVLASLKFNIHFKAKHIAESPSHSSLVKSNSSFSATASFESMTRKLLQASLSTATRASYNRMLKAYEQFCLSPELYKGHSFRIGAASEAAKGTSLSVIQQMGRWKSNALQNYIRMDNF
ncbi:unnamed protein product [Mytilus edulis]|uniref:Uncharacterized protein n=1 Tax=Mytilus edulis TaxID=6550 RepID=A0A8S3QKJ8_MYTED|nr:unnamed protein product [Mytilus edulis]